MGSVRRDGYRLTWWLPGTLGAIPQVIIARPIESRRADTSTAGADQTAGTCVPTGSAVDSIVLKVRGEEAARTFIDPGNTDPAVLIDGVTDLTLRNFTVINATAGVSVINTSTGIMIANNVFDTVSGVGVTVDVSSSAEILYNVFWDNGTAVFRSITDAEVRNNIFVGNTLTIAPILPILDPNLNVDFNCFFLNDDVSSRGSNPVTGDPLFVETALRDFHLRVGSACIDAGDPDPGQNDFIDGTRADIGAYGGPLADVRPYPVAAPTVSDSSAVSPPPYNVDLSWDANFAFSINL